MQGYASLISHQLCKMDVIPILQTRKQLRDVRQFGLIHTGKKWLTQEPHHVRLAPQPVLQLFPER